MMKMFQKSKSMDRCQKCRCYIGEDSIVIMSRNSYLCERCYKESEKSIDSKATIVPGVTPFTEEDYQQLMHEKTLFMEEKPAETPQEEKSVLSPKEIVEYLDKNIVGQDEAKKALAVTFYNHYRRINSKENSAKIPKSNIIMNGPTGTGKTYLIKNLAKIMDVPLYIADVSSITEAGYKGKDPESILAGLYNAADYDVERTEKGIVFLDEFDKLSSRFGYNSNPNSSTGAGVQRQILKILEGTVVDVPKAGRNGGPSVQINTENILFICGGAFVGIEKCRESKYETKAIGFSADIKSEESESVQKKENKLTTADFIEYGLIPEVVGRLPIIVTLNDLKETDICKILTDSGESIIESYKSLLGEYGVNLTFTQDAIKEIAHQAYIRGTGARGINAIVEGIMRDLMYEIPSDPTICGCIISKDVVMETDTPIIAHKSQTEEHRNAS